MKKLYIQIVVILLILLSNRTFAACSVGDNQIMTDACAAATAGWTYTNGTTTNNIQQSGYWLVEKTADVIISPNYSVNGVITVQFQTGTYGTVGVGPNTMIAEYNTGSGWVSLGNTSNPTSSSYVTSTLTIPGAINSTTFQIRFRNTSSTAPGLRLDNIFICEAAPACTPPSTQASNITFSNVSNTSMRLNWTNGNGNNRIVVVKAGSAVAGTPTNGTSYSANATFGSGATIATNEYVVYNGNGSFVDVTGLSCNTTYHVKVFEYNNTGTCYLTTSPPSNSQITLNPFLTQQTLPALNTFTYAQGSGPSASQYREYTATNLAPSSGTVRVTTSQITRYEVSLDNSTFSNFVDISYTGGAFTNVPVYVRLKSGLGIGSAYTANMTATVQSQPLGCTAPVPSYSISGNVTAAPCQELFISEYIEGLAFDKAIEIYNPTANPISLTNYNIKIYSNGNVASSYTANLVGTIPAYGTWVAANVSSSAAILANANQTFPQASFSFDGNDAITLEYNSNILDIFGRIGENPAGGKWISGSYETAEQTLIRKPTVQLGVSANPTSGFPTLSTEWLQYGQSESALLGTHYSTCNNTNVIIPNTITPTQYCVSSNQSRALNVGFITNGTFNTGNVFHAQLSDASGNFSSPILIGSLSLSGIDVSGIVNAAIPAGTTAGTEYRVRVIATLPNGILGAYISPTKITVNVGPVNPTAVSANSSGSGNVQLTWANPTCFDEMLVIMCTDAPVTTIPTGDGSNYNVTGISECLFNACEKVIYKGTGTSINLSGLEDGRTYNFKIFTRMGTLWSNGVSASATPNGATTIQPGDFAIVGMNSNNSSCGAPNAGDDSIYFVCFKDIKSGTSIDITDNGWSNCTSNKFNNTEGFYRVTYTGTTIPAGTVIAWYLNGNNPPASPTVFYLAPNWAAVQLGDNATNTNSGGDQLFFLQGGVWNNGTTNNHDATYTGGRYLFAFNTKTTWGAAPDCSTTSRRSQFSQLPADVSCFEQSPSTAATDFFLYTGAVTFTDKFTWLQRFLNSANWTAYTNCTDFNTNINSIFPNRSISIDNTNPTITWTGTANTNWFDCQNWSSNLVPDANVSVVVPNTGNKPVVSASASFSDQYQDVAAVKNLTIQSGGLVTIDGNINNRMDIYGNLLINSGGQIDGDDGNNSTDDGTIKIAGNWTNNNGANGFLQGNSTVKFFGQNTQIVDISSGTEEFHNLTIEKSLQTYVELNDNISTSNSGVLKFSCGGIIRTNTNKVTVNNLARTTAIIGYDVPNNSGVYSNDKYVFGNLERNINTTGIYEFPVGDIHTGEAYNPIRLDINSGSGMATAKFTAGSPGTINVPITNVTCSGDIKFIHYTGMTGEGWWNMSSSTSTTFGYNVYLHPNVVNLNTFPNNTIGGYKNNYRALKATTGTAGGSWPNATAFDGDECIVSDNYYEIIGVGYSGFSDFAPGGGSGNTTALPVELISFTSTCIDNSEVELSWATASEVNSKSFVIEKSIDAINFSKIVEIEAKGFSNTIQNYSFTDVESQNLAYYRLKQYDIDGSEHIFNIIYVKCGSSIYSIDIYYAGDNLIKANINSNVGDDYTFNLYQYDGKSIYSQKQFVEAGKQTVSVIPQRQLAKGIYIIQYMNSKNMQSKKIMID
jgi:hypothetical protein